MSCHQESLPRLILPGNNSLTTSPLICTFMSSGSCVRTDINMTPTSRLHFSWSCSWLIWFLLVQWTTPWEVQVKNLINPGIPKVTNAWNARVIHFREVVSSYLVLPSYLFKERQRNEGTIKMEYKGEPLPEKIPWEGEFTLTNDPWAGLIASSGSF